MNEPGGGILLMEVITTGHSAYRLQYYVVWVCKYRRRILKPGVSAYLHIERQGRQDSGQLREEL